MAEKEHEEAEKALHQLLLKEVASVKPKTRKRKPSSLQANQEKKTAKKAPKVPPKAAKAKPPAPSGLVAARQNGGPQPPVSPIGPKRPRGRPRKIRPDSDDETFSS
jgi:hypothetical protein